MTGPNTILSHPGQNKGELLLKEQRLDEKGQGILVYEREVDAHDAWDYTQEEGLLGVNISNERNRRRSRKQWIRLDQSSPFIHQTQDRLGKADLGATRVVTSFQTLPNVNGEVPEVDENDLTLLECQHVPNGRNHYDKIVSRASGWDAFEQEVFSAHPDAGGNALIETREVVDPATALPEGSTILDARKVYIDSHKSLLVVRTTPDGQGTLNSYDVFSEGAFGDALTTTTQIVDLPYTPAAATWLTVVSQLKDLGNGKAKYIRADVASWPVFVDETEDESTGLKVTSTRTIVNRASPPSITYGSPRYHKQLKWLDAKKGLLVERQIHADILTQQWTEFHNVKFYFPSYLDPTTPFSLIDDGQGNWAIVPNKSSDVYVSVPARFLITYHTTPQVPDEIFQFKPVDLHLTSPDFRLAESDIITDSGDLEFTIVNFGDGGSFFHISWAIPASSPTATELLEEIVGTEQLIADDSIRWKFNLYRRTRVYLKIPEFNLGLGASLSYY